MKLILNSIYTLTVISLLFGTYGCKTNDPDTVEYIISIDSILHADTITAGDVLDIKFYGTIGENGCYAFERFEPVYNNNVLSITSWGLHTESEMCTQQIQQLNGLSLQVSDLPAGNITIEAIQPDNESPLIQEVFVK